MTYCLANKDIFIESLTSKYFVGFNPYIEMGIVVFNGEAKKLIDFLKTSKSFRQMKENFPHWREEKLKSTLDNFLKFSLIKKGVKKQKINFSKPKILTVWLTMTDQCNLRCRYCFIPKGSKKMDWLVAKRAVEIIFSTAQKNGFKKIVFSFAGGEPTLNFELVKKIIKYAEFVNEKYKKFIMFKLITNGVVLTNKVIKDIKEINKKHILKVQISMDGIGRWHDKQRIFPSNKGSFSYVKRSLSKLLKLGIYPAITAVINGQNCQGLYLLVRFALKKKLWLNFNFYKESQCTIGDESLRLKRKETVKAMKKAYKEVETFYRKRSRSKRIFKPYYVCSSVVDANFKNISEYGCSAGISYFAIDCEGNILPCAHDLQKKVTNILANNDNNKDIFRTIRGYFKNVKTGMKNPSVNQKKGCADCRWRYWCGGGCPSRTYCVYGTYYRHSPYCQITKELIPEFLKLEGYRVLSEKKLL